MGLLDPPAVSPKQLVDGLATRATRAEAGVSPLSYSQRPPLPTLTKRPDLIIGTRAQTGLASVYVPWMIRVPDAVFQAYPQYGRWRVYTSTDHDTGQGGIAIAVCPTDDDVLNPAAWTWLRNAGSGVMFSEGGVSQTETPSVVWNPDTSLFHLYYQVATGTTQNTKVATSVDGVTGWTIVGTAIANPPSDVAGWNHTGYARVYYIDGLWVASHLMGSGSQSVSAYGFSYSYDGITFFTDRRRMGPSIHYTDGVQRYGLSTLFHWRGTIWGIGNAVDAATTGKTGSTDVKVWMAPMNADDNYRSLRGRVQWISWPLTAPETTQAGPPPSYGVHPDGRLIGAYRVNGESGSIALAVLS